ncbi:SEC-C metal-binding domain-containing protein [Vitreimonas flagellata]|uniref:SEC-C metal-binding domain-containing protein n=1 Tax=Vitreimonas flagellata TaxID=2560861 RepID=UPI003B8380F9
MIEKLGRNDLCPCGSRRLFQALLHKERSLRRSRAETLFPRGLRKSSSRTRGA